MSDRKNEEELDVCEQEYKEDVEAGIRAGLGLDRAQADAAARLLGREEALGARLFAHGLQYPGLPPKDTEEASTLDDMNKVRLGIMRDLDALGTCLWYTYHGHPKPDSMDTLVEGIEDGAAFLASSLLYLKELKDG